ncbi:HAUS augmin-like complex subunit 7 [Trichoplax sp. H2]|uniref:Uncharacterized protein n=1 Tax=Trichoplax adhaerens TaxID=10228 RepID=B3RWX5_TRIAD|nr:hypothetical protein TRIADDRAFT_56918 [Trichoplax adhaerens]EDV25208.1 hypothetical protein TRIADDRAFT_56918 [Trichoplax adhaerens]RDD44605.1 HAUS augmin-like complex subunit 7 [Trichoplax sp. H2]|eukprot:XP_002113098.1 hypothetical protein TRIADDRAFT_56918 [Trichoplax adhaerens]
MAGSTWVQRLESLDCPYVEDVDESWVTELIFKPGEARIRLLQWLFARLEPSIEEILDNQTIQASGRGDSRLQTLLFIASSLGLCATHDIELIKGTCPASKQKIFMNTLIDVVCAIDQSQKMGSGHLEKKFTSNCLLMDKICHQENLQQVFLTNINLFPYDLTNITRGSESASVTEKDYKDLLDSASSIADQLVERQNQLADLKSSYSPCEYDMNKIRPILRRLKLTLSTLAQIMAGFSHCYETEIKTWCQKPSPRLSALGLVVKRVDSLLAHFSQTLQGIATIKGSYEKLGNDFMTQTDEALSEEQIATVKTLDGVRRSVDILEKSVSRLLSN